MSTESEKVIEATELIHSHFGIERAMDYNTDLLDSYSLLEEYLKGIIEHLLRNDMEKLLHAIYRIDIDERKFNEALASTDFFEARDKIVTLILKREFEKAESRLKYKNKDK